MTPKSQYQKFAEGNRRKLGPILNNVDRYFGVSAQKIAGKPFPSGAGFDPDVVGRTDIILVTYAHMFTLDESWIRYDAYDKNAELIASVKHQDES